jgi:hypothetical protein
MRTWLWVLLASCGSQAPPVHHTAVANRPAATKLDEPPADPDPDHDRIVGACDLCPNEPETYNGILDDDGCPDSSGTSHEVMFDATNRFAYPAAQLTFRGAIAQATMEWAFDNDVEVVAAIGRGPTLDVAKQRAAALGKFLRGYLVRVLPNVQVVELATTAARIYVDPELTSPESPSDALVQVLRAGTIDVWRWTGDHLERARPRRKLEYSPLLPKECIHS